MAVHQRTLIQMPSTIPPTQNAVILKFGGGLNTRASDDQIADTECADGRNFALDLENKEAQPRAPINLVATATNAGAIRGFAQLLKRDGTVKTLVQAGTKVYEWDGASSFTDTGVTVNANAKLRGHLWHNWTLDQKVIITDIGLVENVKEYDGTTFQDVTFTGGTNFKAKYCFVDKERAFYGNVEESGTAVPHMLVGSQVEDYTTISVADKPSSSLAVTDPFYILTPDLRPLNSVVSAFGQVVMSSREGSIFVLNGSSSQDYAINSLYPRSFCSGDEAMAFIGNDIAYGRPGRIESLMATNAYGDVESNDISRKIANQIESEKEWMTVYNGRLDRVYFFPSGTDRVWVLHKSLLVDSSSNVSPWSLWTTTASFGLSPSCAMSLIDPQTGLENVFFGDESGNIYRLDGTGTSGDGGTTNIEVSRTSKLFPVPLNADAAYVEGWIKYRRQEETSITIDILWGGQSLIDKSITMTLPGAATRALYGGGYYYSDSQYYGASFRARLIRQPLAIGGRGSDIQIKISTNGTSSYAINEIGIRFVEAKT